MNKLVKKGVDVSQLTIARMYDPITRKVCPPEVRSQFMNCAAEIVDQKTVLTENRLIKYEALLEEHDDEDAPEVKTIKEEIEDKKLTKINFNKAIRREEIIDGDRSLADALANAEPYLNQVREIDLGVNKSYFEDKEVYENIFSFFSFQK